MLNSYGRISTTRCNFQRKSLIDHKVEYNMFLNLLLQVRQ